MPHPSLNWSSDCDARLAPTERDDRRSFAFSAKKLVARKSPLRTCNWPVVFKASCSQPPASQLTACDSFTPVINSHQFGDNQIIPAEVVDSYVIPLKLGHMDEGTTPTEICDSLARFTQHHPDPDRVAFLMMRFGNTKAHRDIVDAVRAALGRHGIVALRADDKDYHDGLLQNVQTYMHDCGFGIAIFERIETESFNPNVSFEVGYMLALGKPVCLLKDRTLTTLQTDLIGRLYKQFDPLAPKDSILPQLTQWLSDRGLGQLWINETTDSPQTASVLFKNDGSGQYPVFRTTDGQIATMIFRSKERADFFSEGRGYAAEWQTYEMGPQEMIDWLNGAQRDNDVTEIAINPDPGDSHWNAPVIPISVVIEIFRSVTNAE